MPLIFKANSGSFRKTVIGINKAVLLESPKNEDLSKRNH